MRSPSAARAAVARLRLPHQHRPDPRLDLARRFMPMPHHPLPTVRQSLVLMRGQERRNSPRPPALLCRFLDAGGTKALRRLRRPASKKRQGTKSRSAGQRLGVERYGDLRLAADSMRGATPGRRGPGACTRRGERGEEASRAEFEGRRRAPGAWIALNRVERDRRRRGASAPERGCGGTRRTSGS